MPLTNLIVKNAKPKQKITRLYDERGLYLEIAPSGSKGWRFKYRIDRKEKRISFGVYPDIGLKEARVQCEEARKLVALGIDPSVRRKVEKALSKEKYANTFEVIAREWWLKDRARWTDSHAKTVIRRLEKNVFPWLGREPIADISVPALISVIRKIEERGVNETAHRTLNICGQILRYAVQTGRAQRDITADLKGVLRPVQTKHLSAVVEPRRAGELLRELDAYQGTLPVRCALRLAPLVFVRPGELRTMRWKDIDFTKAEWSFVVSKTQTQHIVPLATQALAILKELYPVTGQREYVFPNARSPLRPMSDNAILAALRRQGIPKEEMSGHGFRAMARTILDEILGFRPDIIEQQLAHRVRDPLGRAYNRTAHLVDRKKMMQAWADYMDKARGGENL